VFEKTAQFANAPYAPIQGTISAGIGQSNPYAEETKRVLVLDEMTNRIGNTNSRLLDLLVGMRSYADNLMGSVPEASGRDNSEKLARSPARLEGLSSAISTTDELTSAILGQFERLRYL
jgi:hypothetical protein